MKSEIRAIMTRRGWVTPAKGQKFQRGARNSVEVWQDGRRVHVWRFRDVLMIDPDNGRS